MWRILAILTISIATTCAFQTTKIEGIQGGVRKIEFDLDYNSYVYTYEEQGDASRLYKLDVDKKIVLTETLPYFVHEIVINSKNDVYLFGSNSGNIIVRILQDGSESSTELYESRFDRPIDVFIDKDDNIFHSTDNGIVIFRTNDLFPNLIQGLENVRLVKADQDDSGNVYLIAQKENEIINSLYVITNEGKNDLTARILIDGTENPYEQVATLKVTQNNEVLIGGHNKLRLINKNGIETLIEDEGHDFGNFYPVDKKTFFVDVPLLGDAPCRLDYERSEDCIQLVNLNDMASDSFCNYFGAKDKENNLFVGYFVNINQMKLMVVKPDDEIVRINFQSGSPINGMLVDEGDNLWLFLEDVYVLEKGSGEVNKIQPGDDPYDWIILMKENKGTAEIFLGALNGLFVVSK